MSNLDEFRKMVDQALQRARRNRKDLARTLGISEGELSHRITAYHYIDKNGKERTWSLAVEDIYKIVEALANWKGITSRDLAQKLFMLMGYPPQEIDWLTPPWSRLHADPSSSHPLSSALQPNAAELQQPKAGMQEQILYLQHVIRTNEWLMLPGGREIPLEQIYVSLRADEMHAKERQAEHALYLQEVAALSQEAGANLPDSYMEFAVLRKVIARYPKMVMLDARNWPRLLGKREQRLLTLAEVVQTHQQVVILGDPGSGKTTLGKWLVLQFARALSHLDARVYIPLDLVQPGAKTEEKTKKFDLGPAKVPVLVSVAHYARIRKSKERPNHGLTLYEYLQSGSFLDPLRLPFGLSQETAGALVSKAVRQGQAFLVLDGLDEVSDPMWRRKIMEAVRRFLQEWCPLEAGRSEYPGNQIVLTSRLVGYQFDPLVELPHYTVEDMDKQAIETFCHTWMRHVNSSLASSEEAKRWVKELHDAIFNKTHPSVRSMAGNPLLLTILVQLSWETRTPNGVDALPVRRVSLFEKAMRTFYDQREALWDQVGITPLRLTQALAAVAYGLHSNEIAGFATEEDVRIHLQSVLKEKEQVEAVLEAAREISGFLIARGEGIYGFLHRAVQEFFAAHYLVSQSGQVESVPSPIMAHALNPTWREPVVLAFSLMSRPRYPEKVLTALFTNLLDLPDSAGSMLPRRELLAVAACVECERIPDGVGRRVAQGLLSIYSNLSGLKKPRKVQQSIYDAFDLCQQLPIRTRMEVEDVLCIAIQAEALYQRVEAIQIIIARNWYTPAIAAALVGAWRTYADPAGLLLVALQSLSQRQPSLFHDRFLPFRQQMAEKRHLWEFANTHHDWQSLLRILYLPKAAPFVLEWVNRDSLLTQEIITVLEQAMDNPGVLHPFLRRLQLLAAHPGTALARDATLALSAIGEQNWIASWGEQIRNQEHLADPALAALVLCSSDALAQACNRVLAFALDLAIGLNRALALDFNLGGDRTLALKLALNHDLDHGDLAHSLDLVRDLYFTHILDLDISRAYALDFNLDGDRALVLALALNRPLKFAHDHSNAYQLDLTHDRNLVLSHLDKLEHQLQDIKKHRWDNEELISFLDVELTKIEQLKREMENALFTGNVWTTLNTLVDTYQKVSNHEDSPPPPRQVAQITSESLPKLMEQLMSLDDEERYLARTVLTTRQKASTRGKDLIELMAQYCLQLSQDDNENNRLIGIYLERALAQIIHDQPDWICIWIDKVAQTQKEIPALLILENICYITSEVFDTLLQTLPMTASHVRKRLFKALLWLVRRHQVPRKYCSALGEQLLSLLDQETDDSVRKAIIAVLGSWRDQETAHRIGISLLTLLEATQNGEEESTIAMALAHLARSHPALREPIHALLLQKTWTCGAALVSLWTTMTKESLPVDALLSQAGNDLSDPVRYFAALLEAGSDDDMWDEWYHGRLANAAQQLLKSLPESCLQETLQILLGRFNQSLNAEDWPTRRMILAVVAACAETMPTTLRQASGGKLEQLLVKGTRDLESFNSRCFALIALGYLRIGTVAVVQALFERCQDDDEVRQAAMVTARRLHRVEGDPLLELLPKLTGMSASTAYVAAHLLEALGTSTAGTSAGLQEHIINALVQAIKDPRSKRRVIVNGGDTETLAHTLYDVLFRVAGWID